MKIGDTPAERVSFPAVRDMAKDMDEVEARLNIEHLKTERKDTALHSFEPAHRNQGRVSLYSSQRYDELVVHVLSPKVSRRPVMNLCAFIR